MNNIFILTFYSFLTRCFSKLTIYKCSNKKLQNGLCSELELETEDKKIYSVQECPKDTICNLKLGNCIYQKKFFHGGERCNFNGDCYSRNCVAGKCIDKKVGQKCLTNSECEKGTFCSSTLLRCKKFLKEGERCNEDIECGFGYVCGFVLVSLDRKCIKAYSVKPGYFVSDVKLCQSGKIKNNICIEVKKTYNQDKCLEDNDCVVSVDGATENGKCLMNLIGEKYCDFTSDSNEWKNFINLVEKKRELASHSQMYSVYLYENNWGDLELRAAYQKLQGKLKNVPDCIFRVKNFGRYFTLSLNIFLMLLSLN